MHEEPPPLPPPHAGAVSLAPLPGNQRFDFPDILRGFAVGGIFLVNIISLKSPAMAATALGEWRHGGFGNVAALGMICVFASAKFLPLFALLFGAGMVMQRERVLAAGRPFAGYFIRRCLWLFVIGMLHAAFFWAGDVLAIYAVFGVCGLVFVGRKPEVALAVAVATFAGFLTVSSLMYAIPQPEVQAHAWREWLARMADWLRQSYCHGSPGEIVWARLSEWWWMNLFGVFTHLPYAFSFFLFGMYLAKAEWIRRIGLYRYGLRVFIACALPAGILLSVWYPILVFDGSAGEYGVRLSMSMAALWVGGLLLSFSYAGILYLVHERPGCRWLMGRFAATGRMALSNYVLQSVIASLLFTNYGLGWYGSVGVLEGVWIVAVVYGLQLVLCPVWLRYFTCGPMEWVWRRLAYGVGPAFRRR